MIYTARFAHLMYAPPVKVGSVVKQGAIIGIMGSSGQSTAPHLHLDVVCGEQSGDYSLASIENGKPLAAPLRQLLYFIDFDLFRDRPIITTQYADLEYFHQLDKVHFGLDVVPSERFNSKEFPIYWNRSKYGRVVKVGYDEKGYGHHAQIAYDA